MVEGSGGGDESGGGGWLLLSIQLEVFGSSSWFCDVESGWGMQLSSSKSVRRISVDSEDETPNKYQFITTVLKI